MNLRKMWLNINGVDRVFTCDPEADSLADVLRRIGLTGTKVGCGTGVCGSCSVILNGELVRSCTRKVRAIKEYSTVITIEGIGTPQHPHPIQIAWMNCGAVQCGFCTPGFIVSTYALLMNNPNPTRQEAREWFTKHRNVCRCTGYKQIIDAVMAAAKVMRGEASIEDITVKNPDNGEYYGKPLVRPTAMAKVCGLYDYGDDQELSFPENTLYGAVVQPRVTHHAKILAIHTEEAEKMPGVYKVVTAEALKAAGGTNVLAEGQFHERSTVLESSRRVLCDEKIFRYGDVIAVVCADTRAHAKAAAAKVTMDIEQLPESLSYLEAVMPDAARVHEDTPNIYCEQPLLKGVGLEDAEKVREMIDGAPNVVEGSFYSTRQPHMSIEGDIIQSYFDEDGFLTFQCKSQGVYSSISRIGGSLGVPTSKIRVLMNPTGASFGWSTNASDLALCGACTVATGMPVSLSMTYEEHQHFSGKRAPAYSNGRLACDNDGKIIAAEYDFGVDHGAYSWGGDDLITKVVRHVYFPYNVPHVAALGRIANTNHNFATAYRSYGSPQAYTHSESMMDLMAEKLGLDPFEIRWRNIAREGDTTTASYDYPQYPMEEIMKRAKPVYEEMVAHAKETSTPDKLRGVGVAWGGFNVTEGATDEASADLELNPDGTITKYDTYQELGQGGDIGSLMLTLEALKPLGIKPEQVRLVQNDTKLCPDSGMSGASRTHFMSGNATIDAANKLLAAMRKADGTYRTYDEMVAENIPTRYRGTYSCTTAAPRGTKLCRMDPNTGVGNPNPSYTYCFNIAEVEVDAKTGKASCIRFACVTDVGKPGNIAAVLGQAYGGISHSIGFALSENYDDVKIHGNIARSGVPYCTDTPDDIDVILYERPDEIGPFGSSGSSEAFQASGHVAVLNGIKRACGVRIYELPASPDKIKAGMDAIAAGEEPFKPEKYFLGDDMYERLADIKEHPVTFGGDSFYAPLDDKNAAKPF